MYAMRSTLTAFTLNAAPVDESGCSGFAAGSRGMPAAGVSRVTVGEGLRDGNPPQPARAANTPAAIKSVSQDDNLANLFANCPREYATNTAVPSFPRITFLTVGYQWRPLRGRVCPGSRQYFAHSTGKKALPTNAISVKKTRRNTPPSWRGVCLVPVGYLTRGWDC